MDKLVVVVLFSVFSVCDQMTAYPRIIRSDTKSVIPGSVALLTYTNGEPYNCSDTGPNKYVVIEVSMRVSSDSRSICQKFPCVASVHRYLSCPSRKLKLIQ